MTVRRSDLFREAFAHEASLKAQITALEAQRNDWVLTATEIAKAVVTDEKDAQLAQARREAANWKLAYGHTLGIPEAVKEIERLRREAEAAKAESEGRRRTLLEVRAQQREDWIRAERAEAEAAIKEFPRLQKWAMEVEDERDRLAEALRARRDRHCGYVNDPGACDDCLAIDALLTPAPPAKEQG